MMSFERNFKVLEEIPEPTPGVDQEVLAREVATSRPAIIHFLKERPGPEHSAFLRKLLRLGPDKNHYVLESGTFGSRPYIVTKMLPENVSLRQWAEGVDTAPAPAATAPAVVEPAPEPVPAPGEFTQLMQASAPAAPTPVSEPAKPGEFTQLFQAAPAPPATKRFTAPPAGAPPAEPGEFTRLFQAAGSTPTTERYSAPPGAPKTEPGEFTQLFQPTTPVPITERYAPPPPSAAPAGEFTQLFQTAQPMPKTERFVPPAPPPISKPVPPSAPSPAAKTSPLFDTGDVRGKASSEATMMFAAGAGMMAAEALTPSSQKSDGDDEFARKFGAVAVPIAIMKAPALPSAQAAAEAAEKVASKANPYTPLIIGLGILLLAILLLIVFFAVRG